MISNKDRSGYIGASDTKYVVGNWKTKTFEKWWWKKIGIDTTSIENESTKAGNNYEHKIIDALNIPDIEYDKQIIKGRIRVNLDSNTPTKIHEIKTYKYSNGFDIKKHKDYREQVQVQMYISEIHSAEIDAYGLLPEDYKNYFNEINLDRLEAFEIEYDEDWILNEYKPKADYLCDCLEKGKFPSEEEYNEQYKNC